MSVKYTEQTAQFEDSPKQRHLKISIHSPSKLSCQDKVPFQVLSLNCSQEMNKENNQLCMATMQNPLTGSILPMADLPSADFLNTDDGLGGSNGSKKRGLRRNRGMRSSNRASMSNADRQDKSPVKNITNFSGQASDQPSNQTEQL